MGEVRLEVTDALGRRVVPITKPEFAIGRRETNDLRLAGSEVSRDHAQIVNADKKYVIKDRDSRYGTFVNGEQISGDRQLVHGDRIRLGRTGGAEMLFLIDATAPPAAIEKSTTTAIGDLRQITALLEGLRALGSGRVLDDVLALVLNSAIEVSGAERGFIMLEGAGEQLEFKMGRGRGRTTLSGGSFATSRKIPEEVFRTGEPRLVADLLDGELKDVHMGTVALGIRNVLCVPLKLVRYLDRADAAEEERRIGVLYLDSREKGILLSSSTKTALETFATEAAVAIENARLYRETMEKARLEQEMRIAAEIQQALLPKMARDAAYFTAAAASLPCRSIGGDFYDYVDLPDGAVGFVLGDVAGKGPPAALLSAMMQGMFAAQAARSEPPSTTISRVNLALYRRGIESRFVTLMYGALEDNGRLTYCNAGHNPPLIISAKGDNVRRLECGGPIVGLFEGAPYDEETVTLSPGDWLIVFSDGVSEALSADGDEYGDARIVSCVQQNATQQPQQMLESLFADVRQFAVGAAQSDDITAMVLRYRAAFAPARSAPKAERGRLGNMAPARRSLGEGGSERVPGPPGARSVRAGVAMGVRDVERLPRRESIAVGAWLVLGIALWNGVYDMIVGQGLREYLFRSALHDAGRAPRVSIAAVVDPYITDAVLISTFWASLIVLAGLVTIKFMRAPRPDGNA